MGDLNNFELLESALGALNNEMSNLGVSLVELTQSRELICAEYGYGGGVANTGDTPAMTASQVGQYSYFGIFGPYKRWVTVGSPAGLLRTCLHAAQQARWLLIAALHISCHGVRRQQWLQLTCSPHLLVALAAGTIASSNACPYPPFPFPPPTLQDS